MSDRKTVREERREGEEEAELGERRGSEGGIAKKINREEEGRVWGMGEGCKDERK